MNFQAARPTDSHKSASDRGVRVTPDELHPLDGVTDLSVDSTTNEDRSPDPSVGGPTIRRLVTAALEWKEATRSQAPLTERIQRVERAGAKLQAALDALPDELGVVLQSGSARL